LICVLRDLVVVVGGLRAENTTLKLAFSKLRAEHQIIKRNWNERRNCCLVRDQGLGVERGDAT